ncbi:MAG: IS1634 family transposase [Clostridiaceae bacterium]|nr:IS1634 family transposase [Clostridiaceae bacterium]
MFLRQATNSKTGRTYLSIVEGYWDSKAKISRTKTIRKIGYLDEFQKDFPDPIAHFKDIAQQMTAEKPINSVSLTFDLSEEMAANETPRSMGYAPLSKIYHELELHTFFNNRARTLQSKYNTNNIMKMLVFSRILDPTSKKKSYENKDRFFGHTDFSLNDVYRSLTHFAKHIEACQNHINARISKRNTEVVYYDVTNYYFEIDEADNLRKKGVSKEHRPDPIVQMGLFMDSDGIPISYKLYPGNTNDCETLRPGMAEIKRNCDFGRVIVVADKGVSSHKNIVFNLLQGDGYVYSQTVRGGHKELKDYVLDNSGYRRIGDEYKIKSRIYPREINMTTTSGKKKTVRIDEKQVIFYSEKYAQKAKADREAPLLKARDLVNNPTKYNRVTSYGAAKYVKNLNFDPKTGEILTAKHKPIFDERKLREDEKLDGYYAIISSELDKTDEEIIEIYRGLWRIEESFKVSKSDLETRPVFVTREDHIQAHFLICFIALTILRLLQKRLGNQFSAHKIAESLSRANCIHLKENHFLLFYRDEVIDALKAHMELDLTRKIMTLGEIKNIFGNVKKHSITL